MRKETELEIKLAKLGFELQAKTYHGKRRHLTRAFIYTTRQVCDSSIVTFYVVLNAKRNKMLEWGSGDYFGEHYTIYTHYEKTKQLCFIEDQLKTLGLETSFVFDTIN